MNVSLIIPTLNNEETLKLCLSSLKPQLDEKDEIIIVDSYSKDNTVKIGKKFKTKILKTKGNRSVARNKGWKNASNNVIIFIESDSIYDKNYIKEVKKLMKKKNTNCLLDKRLHYEPSNWVSKTLNKEFKLRYSNNFKPMNAWILTKKMLKKVNGFDERLEYAEDIDLGKRVKRIGYEILFAEKAVQYHLGEPSTLKQVIMRSWKFGQNMKPFYNKHKNTPWYKIIIFLTSIIFPPLLIILFLTNLLRYKIEWDYKIKLSLISIIRNLTFSISYFISLIK